MNTEGNNQQQTQWLRNARRIGRVLRAVGVESRADLIVRYDKGTTFQNIRGVGPVLGKQLRTMLQDFGALEWCEATGLAWGTLEKAVKKMEGR